MKKTWLQTFSTTKNHIPSSPERERNPNRHPSPSQKRNKYNKCYGFRALIIKDN